MNSDTFKKYNELFQRIRKYPKNKFQGEQLECISKLVFFGGVQRQLIPKLRVRDVFDEKGKAFAKITKFKKEINLNGEMRDALEEYFKGLKSRRSSLANRTSFLFPDYQYERKLKRHWERFDTSHTQIKRDREIYKGEQERQRRDEQIRIRREFIANYKGDIIYDDYDD